MTLLTDTIMKILSLTLVGYRGFRLRQINHFVYRPTQKTQVILGTNGSGKSSLLRELSPLPAQHIDYEKPGRKEIELEAHGRHYLLQSLFDSEGNRYPFIMDGENLNPGYTVTVYKELVKQHFNYTPEIHTLLTGEQRFSLMSVAERRNWFMRIGDTDYTYAIKYFQRLKDKVRDLQGAIKLNQSRLTTELAKCLTEQAEAEIRASVTHLSQMLNMMLDHRKPRLSDSDGLDRSLSQRDQTLLATIAQLDGIVTSFTQTPNLKHPGEASQQQQTLQNLQQALLHEQSVWCEQLEKAQKDHEAVTLSASASLEDTQAIIASLEESTQMLQDHIRLPFRFEQPQNAEATLTALKPTIEDLLTRLSQCERLDYTRDAYQVLLARKPILVLEEQRTQSLEDAAFKEKQTLELHKAKGHVDCPKCHHQWTPGYDDHCYQKAVRQHQTTITQHEQVVSQLQALTKELEAHATYLSLMEQWNRLTRTHVELSSVWRYLEAQSSFKEDPSALLHVIQSLSVDLLYQVKLSLVERQLAEQRKLEALMLNTKQLDKAKLEAHIQQLQAKILLIQEKDRQIRQELQDLKQQLGTWMTIHTLRSRMTDLLQSRHADYRKLLEDRCIGALDEIIRQTKLMLSQQQWQLSQIDVQKGVVTGLKEQITELEEQHKVLKLAMKALSPTEGLIAKGMTNFINHFLAQLNAFIAKIWLYPLELLPIKTEEDSVDLDYRFQVSVNNDPRPSPDVLKTSAGQQEIIDLAFVAVSMKYLGLHHAPIFLDEFARGFDVAHRQMAYQAIDHLIDSMDYSQVFLVSHYQDGYASLSAAEVLVLCDNNIKLPSHLAYNKHVELH